MLQPGKLNRSSNQSRYQATTSTNVLELDDFDMLLRQSIGMAQSKAPETVDRAAL